MIVEHWPELDVESIIVFVHHPDDVDLAQVIFMGAFDEYVHWKVGGTIPPDAIVGMSTDLYDDLAATGAGMSLN